MPCMARASSRPSWRRWSWATTGARATISESGIDALDTVWEFLAYLLTAIVFLLVGLAIPPARLLDSAIWIGWGVAGALVGRAIVVYVLLRLAVRWLPLGGGPAGLPSGWYHVLFWSGLRGAVAVAAALSLPVDVPQRDLLQGVTFGIVLFTLLVQGPTAGLVVRRAVPESGSGA